MNQSECIFLRNSPVQMILCAMLHSSIAHCIICTQLFRGKMRVPLTKSLFKSAGITVSQFFSMLPSTLKYLYSVEPVRMHFPAKQPCTNDTVCDAACSIAHCIICTQLFCGKMRVPLTKSLFKSTGITVSHFFYMLPSTLKYLYSVEPVRMHFPGVQMILCAMLRMQHCTQYHLYTAISRENAFWLVQQNRDTSR